MTETIIVAIITGGLTLMGVLIANNKQQAVMETKLEELAREVREEAGLLVVPESIRECGKVIEKRRDIFEADKIYYCHTYVYFCDVRDEHVAAQMTDSEIRLEYHLSWATPDEIIKANSAFLDKEWIARDTKIVELIKEMC